VATAWNISRIRNGDRTSERGIRRQNAAAQERGHSETALSWTSIGAKQLRENERRGESGMMRRHMSPGRWGAIRDTNTESRVNLSDFEADLSEAGR